MRSSANPELLVSPPASPLASPPSGVLPRSPLLRNTLASVVDLLTSLPEWRGVLATSELDQAVVFRRPPPWREASAAAGGARPVEVRGRDIDRIRRWLEENTGLVVSKQNAVDAVRIVADDHAFHPVRDSLAGLAWDGVPRAARWLEDFAKVRPKDEEHARLVRNLAAKWLVACVARAMQPGCKVDTLLILEGPQGIGKSTALATLAGREYFSDAAIDFGSKDACQVIQGAWIFELAELGALLRQNESVVKAFLTRAVDRFRPPYARAVENVPRSVVFAGTVNHGGYLTDTTGNRRFWTVRCEGPIDIPGLAAAKEQLWAEAVHLYRGSEAWHLGEDDEAVLREEHEERLETDPWEEAVARWLAGPPAARRPVTMDEILTEALGLRTQSKNSVVTRRVSRILATLGYERRRRSGGPRSYFYVPAGTDGAEPALPSRRPAVPVGASEPFGLTCLVPPRTGARS